MCIPENINKIKFHLFFIFVLSYIFIIIIFELAGTFTTPPVEIKHLYYKNIILEGTIITALQEKRNRREFVVKSEQIDGNKIGAKFLVRYYPPHPDPLPRRGEEKQINLYDKITLYGKVIKPFTKSTPKGFNYRKYLARKNIYAIVKINKILSLEQSKPNLFQQCIFFLNKRMTRAIEESLPEKEASVLVRMFTGKRGGLPEGIKDIFTDAGVIHVLVVSGLHVGYVVAVFWLIFKLLPLSNMLRKLLLIPVVIVYAMVTGARPPVIRATIMVIALIICYLLGRERSIYHAFALAAFTILLFNPQALFTASFQMSFSACLGIVYMTPKFAKLLKLMSKENVIARSPEETLARRNLGVGGWQSISFRATKWILYLFFVSLSAQLAVWPLIAYYFKRVSIVSPFANLFVVPFVGIILWLCFGLFFATELLPFIASIFSYLCCLSVKLLIYVVSFFASLPYAVVKTPQISIFFMILYYLCLIGAFKLFFRNIPIMSEN